jgi:glycine hydroxymethyltransferase
MVESDMAFVVNAIDKALMNPDDAALLEKLKAEVNEFMSQFVLYPEL